MVVKFIIWNASSDYINEKDAEKYSIDDFKSMLVNGSRKQEAARFSFCTDAVRYLQSLKGEISPILDEDGKIIVRGYYLQACGIDDNGTISSQSDMSSIQVCFLADRRFPGEKNYFTMHLANDDTMYRNNNRPGEFNDSIQFDKNMINHTLNKTSLDDADKSNIADIYSSALSSLAETTKNMKMFESALVKMMGDDWYMNACSGAAQSSMDGNSGNVKGNVETSAVAQSIPQEMKDDPPIEIDVEAVRAVKKQVDMENGKG